MDTTRTFNTGNGTEAKLHSLPALAEQGFEKISRLPVSIRIVLESLLRNCDGKKVTEADISNLANWNAKSPGDYEIPFTVARIVLQDFTGVPLLVDVAAMRDAAVKQGADPKAVEPLVPVDLVVDHSVVAMEDTVAAVVEVEVEAQVVAFQAPQAFLQPNCGQSSRTVRCTRLYATMSTGLAGTLTPWLTSVRRD